MSARAPNRNSTASSTACRAARTAPQSSASMASTRRGCRSGPASSASADCSSVWMYLSVPLSALYNGGAARDWSCRSPRCSSASGSRGSCSRETRPRPRAAVSARLRATSSSLTSCSRFAADALSAAPVFLAIGHVARRRGHAGPWSTIGAAFHRSDASSVARGSDSRSRSAGRPW